MKEKNLNESIISIRVELQKAKLEKTGKNKFVGFDYFELSDFLPKLNELMLSYGVNDNFTIVMNEMGGYDAKLVLIKGEEKQEYRMPFKIFETPISTKIDKNTGEEKQVKSMQDIQYLGALNTYYKRYLYLNAFGITDGDVIDGLDNTNVDANKSQSKVIYATPKQVEFLASKYQGENLTKLLQANNITKLEELTIQKASELIKKLKERSNNNE